MNAFPIDFTPKALMDSRTAIVRQRIYDQLTRYCGEQDDKNFKPFKIPVYNLDIAATLVTELEAQGFTVTPTTVFNSFENQNVVTLEISFILPP